ncbi:hypothetical protein M514_01243 [Trichuris suis]|uniref:Uncharacterized protein n=1 Tax=Trichuris suis TaxID=68888 RepID=A0A085NMV8_9BILA|nr:hypothetical protein M514_01243 [Trichuris suis]
MVKRIQTKIEQEDGNNMKFLQLLVYGSKTGVPIFQQKREEVRANRDFHQRKLGSIWELAALEFHVGMPLTHIVCLKP